MDQKLSHHLQFGRDTEKNALDWFLKKGSYRLVTHNYRCKMGEIDLILEETLPGSPSPELVFVEVRARSPESWTDGPTSIRPPKQRRLERAIRQFLSQYRGKAQTVRVDLLYWNTKEWGHIKNLRWQFDR
jgi:putative endonuclease